MAYLKVKNWTEFQHYKDRDPPWIKMHRKLLNDYEFSRLQDASKLHLMLIWLLAAQFDGRIPDDAVFLQQKLSLKSKPDLKPLIDGGYLIMEQDDSDTLADRTQDAMPEAEAYKTTEAVPALPEWVPLDAWKGFVEMRKKIKAPMTAGGIKQAIAKLGSLRAEGHDPATILNESTFKSYRGLFAPKDAPAQVRVDA